MNKVKVEVLEQQILEGGKGLASLSELVKRCDVDWPNESEKIAARHAARRAFTYLLDHSFLKYDSLKSKEEISLAEWLNGEYDAHLDMLNQCIFSPKSSISDSLNAMRTMFMFAAKESLVGRGESGGFRTFVLQHFLQTALSRSSLNVLLLHAIRDEYLNRYIDFHQFYLRDLAHLLKKLPTSSNNVKVAFQLLSIAPPQPILKEWLVPTSARKVLKKPFQNAWLAFLGMPFHDKHVQALFMLPELIPHFPQPQLLCDFLTACFSSTQQQHVPFAAFSSLFVLVRDYQLDYPDLYRRLYELLDTFQVDRQPEFGLLMDACFKSSHLPLHLVASFAKKMLRLAVYRSESSGALFALAFVYNLMRRNPSLVFLIHKQESAMSKVEEMKQNARRIALGLSVKKAANNDMVLDPFDLFQKNYELSGAMESSLWEVETLKKHYCPSVSSLAKSIFAHDLAKDRLTKPELPLLEFCTNYSDLYLQEARVKKTAGGEEKRVKVDAPLNVQKPSRTLFQSLVLFDPAEL